MNVVSFQNIFQKLRISIFESARFYYWLVIVITTYFLLSRILQKLSFVYLNNQWTELRIGEGVFFSMAYGALLISALCLCKKIPRYVLGCWGGVVLIFLINEFRFAWGSPDYSLMDSLTKSQGYYTAKFTMPLLFWGVWSALKESNNYGLIIIAQIRTFLKINAVFIIAGAIFSVSLFESYPLTGRWGYSGMLWHLNFHCISYGILLIYLLEKEKKQWLTILLFGVALALLGQKAGLLYLLLISVFVVIKNHYLRLGLFGGSVGAVVAAPLWLPYVVSFLPFWENVYHKYGVWGVVFSLRNETIKYIWDNNMTDFDVIDILIGGVIRFPSRIEMMPFDIFLFYGFLGLFFVGLFFWKSITKMYWGIPLFVGFFAGGIYESPMGMLIYGVGVMSFFKCRKQYRKKGMIQGTAVSPRKL